jgi:hypothetical protein
VTAKRKISDEPPIPRSAKIWVVDIRNASIAQSYDTTGIGMFARELLGPTADRPVEFAAAVTREVTRIVASVESRSATAGVHTPAGRTAGPPYRVETVDEIPRGSFRRICLPPMPRTKPALPAMLPVDGDRSGELD